MDSLSIQNTSKTPEVSLDAQKGYLLFKGRSIPENAIEFYSPVFNWIDQYAREPIKTTEVEIHLEYFNTSSSKCLLDIFKKLQHIQNGGKSKVEIIWCYEVDDEDMLEAGEDYQAIIKLPFKMKAI
jgi:hypothetical protein